MNNVNEPLLAEQTVAAPPIAADRPLNILIVEDSEDDTLLALRALRRGGFNPRHRRVQGAAELKAALAEGGWEAILSDFNLPGFDGMAALGIFQASGHDIPFILVSGGIGEEIAVAAMKAGVSDYISKQNLARLPHALRRELKDAQNRTEARRGEKARELALLEVQKLSRATEQSPASVVITDRQGLIEYVNPKFCEASGYRREELIGQNPSLIQSGQTPIETYREMWQTILTGGEWRSELLNRKKNGELYWESSAISPIIDAAGEISHFIMVNEDITEQKRNLANYARMNRALALIRDCSQLVIHATDETALLKEVCRTIAADGGYSFAWAGMAEQDAAQRVRPVAWGGKDDALMLAAIDDVTWADNEQGRGPSGTAVRSGQVVVKRAMLADPSLLRWHDAYRSLEINSQIALPLKTAGKVFGVVSTYASQADAFDEIEVSLLGELADDLAHGLLALRETAQRRRTEAELQTLNAELELRVSERTTALQDAGARVTAILDTVADGVISINEVGTIETMNPAAERLFAYSASEVIGHNIKLLMPEPHHSGHDGYLARYRATGEAHIIGNDREVEGRRKDGSVFPLELSVTEMQLGGGRHFTGILRDITERKLSERAIKIAKAEAEAANRAKSEFLAAMSHEIRTPMNGVVGMVDVLLQSSLRESQVEMAEIIRESALSLLGIIEDVLDFSKIEAGKLEVECLPTAIAEVVEKTCGMLDHLAGKKNVALTLFTDPALPALVLGDAQRLRQIVINLANNAIKFSSAQEHPGQVSVRVVLAERRPDGIIVDICVRDNGIGMDAATLARLFAAFTQAEASTTRRFGGTGLGLSIARNLTTLMGGEILVESAPGAGSCFTLRLPCVPVADSNALQTHNSSIPSSPVAGLRCLVVGDGDSLADDWAAYLAAAGAQVHRVSDLAAARAFAAPAAAGPWLWLIDTGRSEADAGDLRTTAAARSADDLRMLVLGRGMRRRLRSPDAERQLWEIDANALTRQRLLKVVAIAAGRQRADEASTANGKSASALAPPTRAEALRQSRLILIAEDNEINQKVIVRQLALLGYAADVAGDGEQALARWRSGNYALLLTDLHMPLMDGYQLTIAIRDEERAAAQGVRRIPIIALTANALKDEAQRCLEIGMDDYRSKPVPLAELTAALEKWLPAANGVSSAPTGANCPPEGVPES